jgi:UDP-glucose 4-epimerase
MRILITGGAGYIGSHAVQQLQSAGHQVVVFDNLSTGQHGLLQGARWVKGDLADTALLTETLQNFGVEAVMHFAALSLVGESIQKPLSYFDNNVAGTISLLKAMQAAGVRRFVFSSTAATYGNPVYSPMDEAHPQQPINPYGRTKLMMEQLLTELSDKGQLDFVAFRYFNAAGASSEASIGEWRDPETHLIPNVLKNLYNDTPLTVYGNDYDTPDGTCVRDYVHVDDIVRAHRMALNYLENGGASTLLNLGTGKGASVLEVVRACEKVTGRPAKIQYMERRVGDPPVLVAQADKASEILGWQAETTELETIVATAWAWEQTLQNKLKQGAEAMSGNKSVASTH